LRWNIAEGEVKKEEKPFASVSPSSRHHVAVRFFTLFQMPLGIFPCFGGARQAFLKFFTSF